MYYRDSEFYTSHSSIEVCDKLDALYVDIESYEDLEKERNQLKAQIDRLREKLQLAYTFITCVDETGYMDDAGFVDTESFATELALTISTTPTQCLAEIKADAYWKGYVAGGDDFRNRIEIPLEVVTKKASELIVKLYPDSESAKKIRQQAKGE